MEWDLNLLDAGHELPSGLLLGSNNGGFGDVSSAWHWKCTKPPDKDPLSRPPPNQTHTHRCSLPASCL
jgi:hypothetical protein